MTRSPVADAIDYLAWQIRHLALRPSQQAPAQTCALADRLAFLAGRARPLAFQAGVRLSHRADGLRGRAIAVPFRPLQEAELEELGSFLDANATVIRDAELAVSAACAVQSGPVGGGDAA